MSKKNITNELYNTAKPIYDSNVKTAVAEIVEAVPAEVKRAALDGKFDYYYNDGRFYDKNIRKATITKLQTMGYKVKDTFSNGSANILIQWGKKQVNK